MAVEAFIAANRFGLGARPGELAAIAANPRGWLAEQLSPGPTQPPSTYPTSRQRLERIYGAEDRDASREAARDIARNVARRQTVDHFTTRIVSDRPAEERLVAFWMNHFAVSRGRPYLPALISSYAGEAIRPHIFGKFRDLLRAAVLHPVMLIYLDNVQSAGPNSFLGERRDRDLNENLAREVLELHSLGVNGGYSQADVEGLAAALTGWTVYGRTRIPRRAALTREFGDTPVLEIGHASFARPAHEPGSKKVLGKTYREDGPNEAIAILDDLARHPSTARFIATKLTRHFIADDPPEAAVDAVARAFRTSDGDLAATYQALMARPEVWAAPLPKAKTPQDYVISVARALGARRIENAWLNTVLMQMGQAPYTVPSPKGWPDRAEDWITPGGMMRRVEWVHSLAVATPATLTPTDLMATTIGPVASDTTRRLVGGAASREDAIAFVLSSLEFQRR